MSRTYGASSCIVHTFLTPYSATKRSLGVSGSDETGSDWMVVSSTAGLSAGLRLIARPSRVVSSSSTPEGSPSRHASMKRSRGHASHSASIARARKRHRALGSSARNSAEEAATHSSQAARASVEWQRRQWRTTASSMPCVACSRQPATHSATGTADNGHSCLTH